MRWWLIALTFLLEIAGRATGQAPGNVNWPGVGNDPGCMRYSALEEINRETVRRLEPAWTYHTGELEGRRGKTIECTPIVVDGVLYVTTGYLCVVALDGATGATRLAVRSVQGASGRASGGVGRRQSRLRLLVRPPARRSAADHSRDFRRTVVLARRDHRQARPGLRYRRGAQPARRARPQGRRTELWADVRSRPLDGYDRRRLLLWRRAGHRGARRHPGVRRPDRQGGLAVPDRPRTGRVRTRDVGRRFLEGPRRRECLGRYQHRPGTRPGLRGNRVGGLRLLRRRPPRREPVRQLHDRTRRADGQAGLALSDAAS